MTVMSFTSLIFNYIVIKRSVSKQLTPVDVYISSSPRWLDNQMIIFPRKQTAGMHWTSTTFRAIYKKQEKQKACIAHMIPAHL